MSNPAKRKTRNKSASPPRPSSTAITHEHLWTWYQAVNDVGYDLDKLRAIRGKDRVDPRLLTLSPVCAGVARAAWALPGCNPAVKTATIKAVHVMLNTKSTWDDSARLHVVTDWAVRFSVRRFLELLPLGHPALGLPQHNLPSIELPTALCWAKEQARALEQLVNVWAGFGRVDECRTSAVDTAINKHVTATVTRAIAAVSSVLSDVAVGGHGYAWMFDRSREAFRVIAHLDGSEHKDAREALDRARSAALATLPTLAAALASVDPGEAPCTTADRCVWPDVTVQAKTRKASQAVRR